MSGRVNRLGLFGPFLLLAVVVGGWSLWWAYLAGQVEDRIDAQAERLRQAGWQVAYDPLNVQGWPFRLTVRATGVRLIAPSTHALAVPELVAEAAAYAPGRWVMAAPEGLLLTRAAKGQVDIQGESIRASVSAGQDRRARIVVEMIEPRFSWGQGAEPFPLRAAERLVINAVPRETIGTMGLLLDITGAVGREGGVLTDMAEGRVFDLRAEAEALGTDHLLNADGAVDLGGWVGAGGALTALQFGAAAEDDEVRASSDRLSFGPDGRLIGTVQVRYRGGTAPLAGLARAPGADPLASRAATAAAGATAALRGEGSLTLVFRDGRTWLGPLSLAPAPRLPLP